MEFAPPADDAWTPRGLLGVVPGDDISGVVRVVVATAMEHEAVARGEEAVAVCIYALVRAVRQGKAARRDAPLSAQMKMGVLCGCVK